MEEKKNKTRKKLDVAVPSGLLKTHSELYNMGSTAGSHNITDRVNFNTMAISDIKKFLSSDPLKVNRYNLFDTIVNIDPEINTAIKMISYTVSNSYLGPGYKSVLEVSKESAYIPESETSVAIFQQILSEMQFKRWLPVIVKGLMRDGNVYFRVYRNPDGSIKNLELLPASVITILDSEYLVNKTGVIRRRDYYLVNEELINLASLDPEKVSDLSELDERIIPAENILHFALGYEDSLIKDIKGRNTFGIYGYSPLEPLIFVVKMKLALMLDYMLYSRTGLPRWDFTIDLSNVMNLQNYVGDYYSRLREARSLAQEIFREFESQLYYYDSDPSSPTYGQYLPVEADHMFIHGGDVKVEQKGGIPASSQFLDVVKKCDMCICSIMGVPLSLFGYESGSTYAVSYITKSFMLSLGAGLLREIENTIKGFVLQEVRRRGLSVSLRDFDQIELKFAVDDSDVVQQKVELEKAQITLAIQGFVNGLLTLNEARKRIGYDEIPGGEIIRSLEGLMLVDQLIAQPEIPAEVPPEPVAEVPQEQNEIPVKQENQEQEKPELKVEAPKPPVEETVKSPPVSSELQDVDFGGQQDVAAAYAQALEKYIEHLIEEAEKE